MDGFDPLAAYAEHVGSNPLLDTAARAGLAGSAAYVAAKPLVGALVRIAGASGNPRMQELVARFVGPGGDISKTRRRLAAMAALAGAASGAYSHGDFSKGLKGFRDSMTQRGYWDRLENWPVDKDSPEEMLKIASFLDEPVSAFDDIPTYRSVGLMTRDPLLAPPQKKYMGRLLLAASDGKPKFSQADLARTALQSGIDFGTAFLVGKGVGSMLALPSPVVNRLSVAGGIANAVIGSGLFR
jgi:hypothetical protein